MPPTQGRSRHVASATARNHPGRDLPPPLLALQPDVQQPPHLEMPELSFCLQDRGWVPQVVVAAEPAGRVRRPARRRPHPVPLSSASAPAEPPDSRPRPEHSVSRPLPDSLWSRLPFSLGSPLSARKPTPLQVARPSYPICRSASSAACRTRRLRSC
jgi:hypothetical protein